MDSTNGAKSDWIKILSTAVSSDIPEGFKTKAMLAKEYNITPRQVRAALEKALEKGEVEKIKVNIKGYITNAYKLKTPPN